jgi:tetratricopeptide (TPR) repeat protein
VNFKNGLAISYEKLGSTHTALGNLNKALTFFETETELFKELYDSYPTNVNFKNGLAISYAKLGSIYIDLNDFKKALIYFNKYYEFNKELYESYPANINYKHGLAIGKTKLGMVYLGLNQIDTALKNYNESYELFKELYEDYLMYAFFKVNFAQSMAVLEAMKFIAEDKNADFDKITEAKKTFNTITIQNAQYQARLKLIDSLLNPKTDLKKTVIELSNFTL